MNTDALPFVLAFVGFGAVGWRATLHTWKTYRDIRDELTPLDRLIQQAFVVVCLTISIAASVFGFLSTRLLLGFERLDITPVISWAGAVGIFLLPPYLEHVQNRIGKG